MSDYGVSHSIGSLLTSGPSAEQQRPTKLYHYTSIEALRGILVNHAIHLTHAAFANDPTELNHGLDVMRQMFESQLPEKSAHVMQEIFDSDIFVSNLYYHTQPYIFCLSESEDMLTQWQMYSGRNGCCITFGDEITRLTSEGNMAIRSVIYNEEEQFAYLKYLNRSRMESNRFSQVAASNNQYFILGVVFLKNYAFSHEKEWRIVRIVQEESFGDIEYKSGNRFLRPYVELRCEPLPITEIRIGPSDDQDRLFRSIEHIIKMTEGYEDVEVTRSNVSVSPT